MNTETKPNETDGMGAASELSAGLGAWIPVSTALPAKDKWVQVFEDDNDNPQDAYIGHMCKSFRQRVTPAKLLSVDSEGYADWYLCWIGASPCMHVRNVTHWRPMAEAPNLEFRGATPIGGASPGTQG